jgi:hypothetical protein
MPGEVEMLVLLGEAGSGGRSSTAGGGDEAPESASTGPRDTASTAPPPYVIRSKREGRPWTRGLPKPSIRLFLLFSFSFWNNVSMAIFNKLCVRQQRPEIRY